MDTAFVLASWRRRFMCWPAALYCLFAALVAFFFQLGDLVTVGNHGYVLLECAWDGRLLSFYEIAGAYDGLDIVCYELPMYMTFALWNLPLFIINKVFGLALNYGVVTYWCRLLLFLMFLLLGAVLERIIHHDFQAEEKTGEDAFDLFLTAPLAFFCIVLLGCYDVFCVFFMLLGVHHLLRGNKRLFVIMFALANCYKFFSFFTFVPLLLLCEKRFWWLFKAVVKSLVPILFFVLVSWRLPGRDVTSDFTSRMLSKLFAVSYPMGSGYYGSVFAAFLALLCILVYAYIPPDVATRRRLIAYIPLVVYSLFMLLIPWHGQWVLLLVPFMIINLLLCPSQRRTLLYLEGGMALTFFAVSSLHGGFDERLITICSAASWLFGLAKAHAFEYSMRTFLLASPMISALAISLFSASLVAYPLLCCPFWYKRLERAAYQPSFTRAEKVLRLCCVLAFIAAAFLGWSLSTYCS